MTTYFCWDVDNSEEGDARKVEASCSAFAAERHAEHRDQRDAEYPSERTIRVRTEEGYLFEYTVTLRSEPVYTAGNAKLIEEDRR